MWLPFKIKSLREKNSHLTDVKKEQVSRYKKISLRDRIYAHIKVIFSNLQMNNNKIEAQFYVTCQIITPYL